MRYIVKIIILILSASIYYYCSTQTYQSQKDLKTKLLRPPLLDTSTNFDRIATLGHLGIYHTILNIWTTQVLADIPPHIDKERLLSTLQKMLDKRPRFESMYLYACITADDFKRSELCKGFSTIGLQMFPVSWRISMMQGYISHFKLKNTAEGALFYNLASTSPYAPEYVARVARKLFNRTELSDEEIMLLRDEMAKVIKDFSKIEIVDKEVLGEDSEATGAITPGEKKMNAKSTPVPEEAKEE